MLLTCINYLTSYIYSCVSVVVFYAVGRIYSGTIYRNMMVGRYNVYIFIVVSFLVLTAMFIMSTKVLSLEITDLFANRHSDNFIIWFLGSLAGIIFVFAISVWLDSKVDFVAKIIALIGECSLYVFAFHMTILKLGHNISQVQNLWVEWFIIGAAILLGCLSRPVLKCCLPKIFR